VGRERIFGSESKKRRYGSAIVVFCPLFSPLLSAADPSRSNYKEGGGLHSPVEINSIIETAPALPNVDSQEFSENTRERTTTGSKYKRLAP